ncbi:hypothetical protein LQZ18_11800 [Lachnospiraceae bacterium ZAX-1]
MLSQVWEEIEGAANTDPDSAWDIFYNGNNDEFAALVNCIGEIGDEFDTDNAGVEIIRLAINRNDKEVMEATRIGFGDMFQEYYSKTMTAPDEIRKSYILDFDYIKAFNKPKISLNLQCERSFHARKNSIN